MSLQWLDRQIYNGRVISMYSSFLDPPNPLIHQQVWEVPVEQLCSCAAVLADIQEPGGCFGLAGVCFLGELGLWGGKPCKATFIVSSGQSIRCSKLLMYNAGESSPVSYGFLTFQLLECVGLWSLCFSLPIQLTKTKACKESGVSYTCPLSRYTLYWDMSSHLEVMFQLPRTLSS